MKTCHTCGELQFDHLLVNSHRDWCWANLQLKKPAIGDCSVCETELDNCIWAYWKDGLFCRECVEKSEKEKVDE